MSREAFRQLLHPQFKWNTARVGSRRQDFKHPPNQCPFSGEFIHAYRHSRTVLRDARQSQSWQVRLPSNQRDQPRNPQRHHDGLRRS